MSKDSILDSIIEHLDNQPYEITCSACGHKLNFTSRIDNDYDIKIDVEPCEKCLEYEYDEGYNKGSEEKEA